MAALPLFVTAKIQKISKNAQLYYQKVVNLPFFVTVNAQTKAFTMIYKQKVVILPLFVTFPFLVPKQMTQMGSGEIVYPRIISPEPNKLLNLLGSLLGVYHTAPIKLKHDPHKITISIEFWSRQAYTFAFIDHCTYSTSPTLQYLALIEYIGDNGILRF